MISVDERKVVNRFVTTVTSLENKVNAAHPITAVMFKGLDERAKYVEIFAEFRKCMKEKNHSYSSLISVLEKLDIDKKYAVEFAKVEEIITEAKNRSDSFMRFMTQDERNLSNWDAFQELESKYYMHSDGQRSPIKHVDATLDDEATYTFQVMSFIESVCVGVFGPLCFIAKKLLEETDTK